MSIIVLVRNLRSIKGDYYGKSLSNVRSVSYRQGWQLNACELFTQGWRGKMLIVGDVFTYEMRTWLYTCHVRVIHGHDTDMFRHSVCVVPATLMVWMRVGHNLWTTGHIPCMYYLCPSKIISHAFLSMKLHHGTINKVLIVDVITLQPSTSSLSIKP